MAEIVPNVLIGRHTHFGIESGYVLDGEATLMVAGQPDKLLKAGESYQIPAGVPHDAKSGARGAKPDRRLMWSRRASRWRRRPLEAGQTGLGPGQRSAPFAEAYRSFSVARPTRARITEMIQNRTTTVLSCQPFCS